ncbi:MAG: DUF4410 domain-containing protein [Deltaproteobacteria bacterium]|nr:DUF4410 domain-containing protein [Deltaproteobacteria bacterium]
MKPGIKFGLLTFIVMAVAAGCAPTSVQQQSMNPTQLPRPDVILVYDFAVSPEEVKLDTGLSAELMQKYEQHKGTSRTAEEIKVGHKVAEAVAEELVKKIRGYGLWAERGFGYPHGKGKVLMIKGQFLSIDEGNRTERVAIGLGAGRTSVQANVQIYELTPQGLQKVDTLRGTAKSGYKPGMGEMMGVGAIAGHLLMSTVVSGAVAGGTEMTSATVEADGKRLADKIAIDIGNFFVDQAWIPPDAVKKSFL